MRQCAKWGSPSYLGSASRSIGRGRAESRCPGAAPMEVSRSRRVRRDAAKSGQRIDHRLAQRGSALEGLVRQPPATPVARRADHQARMPARTFHRAVARRGRGATGTLPLAADAPAAGRASGKPRTRVPPRPPPPRHPQSPGSTPAKRAPRYALPATSGRASCCCGRPSGSLATCPNRRRSRAAPSTRGVSSTPSTVRSERHRSDPPGQALHARG